MEEDKRRREYILNIILVGSITMTSILDCILLYYTFSDGPGYKEMSFVTFSILPAFFIFLYALSRRSFSKVASYLLVGAYLVSNSYAAYRWGVTLQVVILTYALIIIVATILLGTKFGFFTTAAISAFIVPLWYAQFYGLMSMQNQRLRAADAFIFAILYFLIMIVAWLYNREIERSLLRAYRSEAELKKERDLLEIKIAERTEELNKTQFEKVEQLNRLAELGQLSSGLFHDVFNLLSAVSLRDEDLPSSSLIHAQNTTRQIENFTHAIQKQLDHRNSQEVFSLTEGIEQAIQLLDYKANKSRVHIIYKTIDRNIEYFEVPSRFHQVVLNLILNAIESYEALPHENKRDRTVIVELEERDGMVMLRVTDNGPGMPHEVGKKIFEPFFTTKGSTKGIGIGLTTIKKIIEENFHGTITVQSKANYGSTFTVIFPMKYPQKNERGNNYLKGT
jgi:signal transduction histidine kinase